MILPLGSRVVYALVDPRDGVVRYVGVTDNPQHRLNEHIGRTRKRSVKLGEWLAELQREKLLPHFVFLDSVKSADSIKAEAKWIAHFQRLSPLFNHKKK
jgi:predicted GIY-YIG superfamily endonuclease